MIQTTTPTTQTQSEKLLALVENLHFFKTPGGEPHVVLPVTEHLETHQVGSHRVRSWLINEYRKVHTEIPGQNPINDTIQVMRSLAEFSDNVEEVFIRIAEHEGNIYLDLCNQSYEVVEVTPQGWTITNNAPVKFRRTNGMLPLPTPEQGGNIKSLRDFLNCGNEETFILLVSALLGMFNPNGPFPILNLNGEQGCAKSSTARYLRGLIDPNNSMLYRQPRDSENMYINAHNAWVLSYDNISGLQQWLSDIFCGFATGSGSGRRTLYSNDEQTTFNAKRPCIINGIEDLATYGDLADRCVTIILPTIPENRRQSERMLNQMYEEVKPRLLGAILDIVSSGLRNLPTTHIENLPRMADFALWVTACEEGLGWKSGTFMSAYSGNRNDAKKLEIEASPVASAIVKFMEKQSTWSSTPTELNGKLKELAPDQSTLYSTWPKSVNKLSAEIRRHAPALREQGISIEFVKGRLRTITISKVDDTPSSTVSPDPALGATSLKQYTIKTVKTIPPTTTPSFVPKNNKIKREGVPLHLPSLSSLPSQPVWEEASWEDDTDYSSSLYSHYR